MDIQKIKEAESFARLFSETADHVNEHSAKRKEIADMIIHDIMGSVSLATEIYNDIKRVTQANIDWRENDSKILSTFQLLKSNIEKQKKSIELFTGREVLPDSALNEMQTIAVAFENALNRAHEALSDIIIKENDIILLDSLLEYKKKYQIDALRTLKKLSDAIANDANVAVIGSRENRERGVRLLEGMKGLSESAEADKIDRLIVDAVEGKSLAQNVLENSKSQYEFNEQVLNFTADFIDECDAVKRLVNQKHCLFEENLQTITVFTVILSFEFKKYIDMQKIFAKLQTPPTMRDEYHTLMMLVDIACRDIKNLTELNYDMTETSHKTNESETKTVEMTDQEYVIFSRLREQLNEMTEMTQFPIEGAEKNIGNAGKIEEILLSFSVNGNPVDKPVRTSQSIKNEEITMSSQKTIMVIDDGAAIRQVVSQVLSSAGFATIEAVDGQDALNKLDGKKIDMFICDVNMPNLNGIQFLEAIRTDEKYRDYRFTPIIMLTTEAGESMKEKGKQLGAKAWIVKPFQPDQLLDKIKPLIA